MKTKTAAVLTIWKAGEMSKKGRAEIRKWLVGQIGFLMKYPDQLAPRYTARYLYRVRGDTRNDG